MALAPFAAAGSAVLAAISLLSRRRRVAGTTLTAPLAWAVFALLVLAAAAMWLADRGGQWWAPARALPGGGDDIMSPHGGVGRQTPARPRLAIRHADAAGRVVLAVFGSAGLSARRPTSTPRSLALADSHAVGCNGRAEQSAHALLAFSDPGLGGANRLVGRTTARHTSYRPVERRRTFALDTRRHGVVVVGHLVGVRLAASRRPRIGQKSPLARLSRPDRRGLGIARLRALQRGGARASLGTGAYLARVYATGRRHKAAGARGPARHGPQLPHALAAIRFRSVDGRASR